LGELKREAFWYVAEVSIYAPGCWARWVGACGQSLRWIGFEEIWQSFELGFIDWGG
jgi:hypothetical protein